MKNKKFKFHEGSTTPYGDSQLIVVQDLDLIMECLPNRGADYVVEEVFIKREYKQATIRAEDTWLDLGGNIGSFTVLAGKICKRVVVVEPDELNLYFLKSNISHNDIQEKVTVLPGAVVSGEEKNVNLYFNQDGNRATNTTRVVRGRETVSVTAYNINSLIEDYGIDCIKMDIEGGEEKIVPKITPNNWKRVKQIIMEFHLQALKDYPEFVQYRNTIRVLERHFKEVVAKEDPKKSWHTIIYAAK